jgi:hypothetical protein
MGSGSALVAAARLGRRYVGYDLDESYVDIARQRVEETVQPSDPEPSNTQRHTVDTPSIELDDVDDFQSRASKEGKAAQKLAEQLLEEAGFKIEEKNRRIRKTGVTVNFVATDSDGNTWFFDVSGAFTSHRGGMLRTDTVWKSLGRAYALKQARGEVPLVLLSSHPPRRPSEGDTALRAAGPDAIFDAIEMLSCDSLERLDPLRKGRVRRQPANRTLDGARSCSTERVVARSVACQRATGDRRWPPCRDQVESRSASWLSRGKGLPRHSARRGPRLQPPHVKHVVEHRRCVIR